ncbi:hypothetical protein [Pseudoclavibacter terrae]|uniref:hypothetical protein n=1 Tax=Pseudoclavibacter terrae TaxID=1530195 RepID=UPI00232E33E8|nr:hypothetical protein [Pseudoclavibacter terrae]
MMAPTPYALMDNETLERTEAELVQELELRESQSSELSPVPAFATMPSEQLEDMLGDVRANLAGREAQAAAATS